ncbi:spermidine synthase [Streptomyces sp. NPDC020096]
MDYTTHEVTVVDRREGPYGEVVLRRRLVDDTERFEIIENGCFLMDTSDGHSERLLVRAPLRVLDGERLSVLIGGLGVGFSLAEAAGEPRWADIAVVERERAVIDWHRSGPLSHFSGSALDDPRVTVIESDLVSYVREADVTYDALCLDIDNGPDWTVSDSNDSLYSPAGLADCRARLAPGGVLAVWSAQPSEGFEDALRTAGFEQVQTIAVPVARGVPDVVHLGIRPA